jgi:hypothetical protein
MLATGRIVPQLVAGPALKNGKGDGHGKYCEMDHHNNSN